VLPAAGPSTRAVSAGSKQLADGVPTQLVDVTGAVARKLVSTIVRPHFATAFGDGTPIGTTVSPGDVLDVSIWEAPPAALFGTAGASDLYTGANGAPLITRNTPLPDQMVGAAGTIIIPFAGPIQAAGRTPEEIAANIRTRLNGKAHDPQVVVRVARNATFNVTVVGEVANSVRMPLTPRGERLLDALATAGGVRQPVGKMTIQLTRGDKVEAMPLEAVIKDPSQNIRLQADDVVTLLFQPYSFTVLGAAKSNQEIPFEGTGLTLSQALGRMGGLDDQRANPKGVFIFRFEDPNVFAASGTTVATTKDGKVPVIYRVNMRDPATLFVAQSFPIKDKDVVYISNAPLADFAKFLQAVSQVVYPIAVIQTTNIF
jgi:polysaccharide export outer membrane protein